ncbi:MAG TPA: hypothetical protein VHR64_09005, partial [Thermomicrobiales bacterium]|nr:hypothetical protein [Thermomicrobiales bacterium]
SSAPIVVLQTSDRGAGSVHIDFTAPTNLDRTAFDVMFRLVDSLTTPCSDLFSHDPHPGTAGAHVR